MERFGWEKGDCVPRINIGHCKNEQVFLELKKFVVWAALAYHCELWRTLKDSLDLRIVNIFYSEVWTFAFTIINHTPFLVKKCIIGVFVQKLVRLFLRMHLNYTFPCVLHSPNDFPSLLTSPKLHFLTENCLQPLRWRNSTKTIRLSCMFLSVNKFRISNLILSFAAPFQPFYINCSWRWFYEKILTMTEGIGKRKMHKRMRTLWLTPPPPHPIQSLTT